MSENRPVQLGLCCMNSMLRKQKPPIFASRKMIIRSVEEKGIDALKEKIIQNLKDVLTLIEWNEQNGIKVFRLSSELFPHKSNPKVVNYTFDFAHSLLTQIGDKARQYNHRLTFHPGQYNVVGSPNKQSFDQTNSDLTYHADVLDLMGMNQDSVMVVHGGGVYGDKEATLQRWCEQFKLLSENVQRRLVLENCEKCFSIEDCLKVSKQIGIPVVFDTHHYACYCILHPDEQFKHPSEYIPDILASWTNRGIKPKFHVSEQGSGRTGHHSDFIEVIPDYLLEIPEKYGIEIDIMIEAKAKEQAILRLYEKYPFLNCKKKTKQPKKYKLKVVESF
ncbi:MAG: UV DNA damage repair endonuclease UvsE [Bacteroidota bacterium]|nr:UV DNA damage repair endonuclease UvsE [Bacteroidota bacterium]